MSRKKATNILERFGDELKHQEPLPKLKSAIEKTETEDIPRLREKYRRLIKRSESNWEKDHQKLIDQGSQYKIGDLVIVKRRLQEADRYGFMQTTKRSILEPGFVASVDLRNTIYGPKYIYTLFKMKVDGTPSKVPMGESMENGIWGGHEEKMLMPYDENLVGKILKKK